MTIPKWNSWCYLDSFCWLMSALVMPKRSVNVVMKHAAITEATTWNSSTHSKPWRVKHWEFQIASKWSNDWSFKPIEVSLSGAPSYEFSDTLLSIGSPHTLRLLVRAKMAKTFTVQPTARSMGHHSPIHPIPTSSRPCLGFSKSNWSWTGDLPGAEDCPQLAQCWTIAVTCLARLLCIQHFSTKMPKGLNHPKISKVSSFWSCSFPLHTGRPIPEMPCVSVTIRQASYAASELNSPIAPRKQKQSSCREVPWWSNQDLVAQVRPSKNGFRKFRSSTSEENCSHVKQMKTGFWPTWRWMQPAGFAQFSGNAEVSITGRSHRGRNLHLYQASSEDDKLFQRLRLWHPMQFHL